MLAWSWADLLGDPSSRKLVSVWTDSRTSVNGTSAVYGVNSGYSDSQEALSVNQIAVTMGSNSAVADSTLIVGAS